MIHDWNSLVFVTTRFRQQISVIQAVFRSRKRFSIHHVPICGFSSDFYLGTKTISQASKLFVSICLILYPYVDRYTLISIWEGQLVTSFDKKDSTSAESLLVVLIAVFFTRLLITPIYIGRYGIWKLRKSRSWNNFDWKAVWVCDLSTNVVIIKQSTNWWSRSITTHYRCISFSVLIPIFWDKFLCCSFKTVISNLSGIWLLA